MADNLGRAVARLVHDIPVALSGQLANLLRQHTPLDLRRLQIQVRATFPQLGVSQRIEEFLQAWYMQSDVAPAAEIALAIEAAIASEEQSRLEEHIEVVWTGPTGHYTPPIRRTEQVLLELIASAQYELHIVSFAVYRADTIKQAIIEAGQRGVTTSIYVETWDAREQKVRPNAIAALGDSIRQVARIYVWPPEYRINTGEHTLGALHAKLAVADSRSIFVTSANLTDHAMSLNMEMGLLVYGGDVPRSVTALLSGLVDEGVFRQI